MILRSLRRRPGTEPASLPPPGPADEILGKVLDRDEIIDRFDASYLDDIHHILRETRGVTAENAREHELWPQLAELWTMSGRPEEAFELERLPEALIRDLAVDPRRWSPKQAGQTTQRRFKYVKTRSWRRARGLKIREENAGNGGPRDAVNAIQKEFSLLSGGKYEFDFEDLARPETGDPWTPLMIDLRDRGIVRAEEPVLTLGPRWVGEIYYFRERIGFSGAIGLDLFTNDEELIRVGDMHDMPFGDNTFGLVYQRNTFDKSYDIRTALRECLRVLRDGGVLISDDCYAYTAGVSEMSRTNIKHNRQLIRVLEPHVAEVLYDREAPSNEDWIERVGQLAVKVRK